MQTSTCILGLTVVNKVQIFSAILLVVVATVILGLSFLIGLHTIISPSVAETILLTLIQVNATLIGFFGVIVVFRFREFSTIISEIRAKALDAMEKRDLIGCDIKDNESDPAIVVKLQRRWDVYNNISNSLTKWVRETAKERSEYSKNTIYSVGGFIVSIFMAIVALSKVEGVGLEGIWFVYMLVPLFFGILVLIMSMILLPPPVNPELDNTKNENT